jgi:hypothetical protein
MLGVPVLPVALRLLRRRGERGRDWRDLVLSEDVFCCFQLSRSVQLGGELGALMIER